MLQRALRVGTEDYTARTRAPASEPVEAVARAILDELTAIESLEPEQRTALRTDTMVWKQLCDWIKDDAGSTASPKSHPLFGRKRQDRHFDSMAELARALLGWVAAKPERHGEKLLAQDVVANRAVALYLDSVLRKVHIKIRSLHLPDLKDPRRPVDAALVAEILEELRSGVAKVPNPGTGELEDKKIGHYRKYIESRGAIPLKFGGDFLSVLQKPEAFPIWDKIVVLHDLMEYFNDARPWVTKSKGEGLVPGPKPTDPEARSTLAIDASGTRTKFTQDRGTLKDRPSTRNESEPSTLFARAENIPVWAGASLTAVRMLNLGRWAGASKSELGAIAFGIFSFWRLAYDHTSALAYHTLHEVMDMASNYGVDYNVKDRGAAMRTYTIAAVRSDVLRTMATLETDVATLAALLRRSGPVRRPLSDGYLTRLNTLLGESKVVWDRAKGQPEDAQIEALRTIGEALAEAMRLYNLLWRGVAAEIQEAASGAGAASTKAGEREPATSKL